MLLVRKVLATGLRFRGLMGYGGHLSHQLPGPEKADAAAGGAAASAGDESLFGSRRHRRRNRQWKRNRHLFPVRMLPGLTEVQAGSYLLMDTNYRECCTDFDLALTVLSTVISKTGREYVIVDAGVKTLSSERGIPLVKGLDGVTLRRLNAEHGIIELGEAAPPITIGDRSNLGPVLRRHRKPSRSNVRRPQRERRENLPVVRMRPPEVVSM